MKEMETTLGVAHGKFAHLTAGRTHYKLEGPGICI